MAFPNPSAAGLAMIQAASTTAQKTLLSLQNVDNTSDATKNSASATLTNKSISGSSNTLSNIAGSSLNAASVTPTQLDLSQSYDFSSGTLRAASPSGSTDVAIKSYVDTATTGKAAVRTFVSVTTTTTLTYNADHNASISGAGYTVTLPTAATGLGDITLTNISNSANQLTVSGGGANIIDLSTYPMPTGSVGKNYSVTFYTDGTNWFIK